MDINTVFGDPIPFVYTILKGLDELGLPVKNCEIDHICYKPATLGQYEKQKQALEKVARLLTETMINGRPIATYELHNPIEVEDKKIPLFELPAPKKGHQRAAQYEHIEMVLTHMALEQLQRQHPRLDWDLQNVHNPINPELTLRLDFGGIVKFHPASLAKVIELETDELLQQHRGKLLITTLDQNVGASAPEGLATLFSVLKCQGVKLHFLVESDSLTELKPIVAKAAKAIYLSDKEADSNKAQALGCGFMFLGNLRHANQLYDFLKVF